VGRPEGRTILLMEKPASKIVIETTNQKYPQKTNKA
jgi:hypothetical protein